MGTSCTITYRCNGINFIRRRWSDGYAERPGAGQELVDSVPPDSDAYKDNTVKVWLENTRAFYKSEWERIKKLDEENKDLDENKGDYDPYLYRPRKDLPELYCDFNYTIDLDAERFCVYDAAFPLWNIPRGDNGEDWLQHIAIVGVTNNKCVLWPDTPRQYRVAIEPTPVSEVGLAVYQALTQNVEIIDESAWMTFNTDHPRLALASANTRGLMMCHNCQINSAVLTREGGKPFHSYSELLLRAASPGGLTLAFRPSTHNNDGNEKGDGGEGEGEEDGDDKANRNTGKPLYSFYRYRGCIVFVTEDCSTPGHLQANIGLAVGHARETGTNNCTVIIFSIRHVAVAVLTGVISGPLQVAHTRAQPFLEGFGDGGLEKDVLLHIMELVDSDTHTAFSLLSALRRNGAHATLIIFYRVFPFYGNCNDGRHCCLCPNLCIGKKCMYRLYLKSLPGSIGLYRNVEAHYEHRGTYREEDYSSVRREPWRTNYSGLFALNASNVCKVCTTYFDRQES
ncbi:uncharacterized protein FOMMEDRAFT_31301 [Fomitiporia mediterranea MF3/22]|uniref:uncharacterized protein n=1 Tax=Fomitiporia mediterranea (strain MF3/22) TaxID=694068 RepID=UPI00044072DF|nr:uncharacterized protein FOMMEDRAFT_31301 [Fomitiporia mediterranea MF3/22]EJC99212.1 hypothetical protein FOMMEDRAFT_31301 [Fomitiporia mediterranea MF3/22]